MSDNYHFTIHFADFNIRMQEQFNIVNEISSLIYGGGQDKEMFVYNEYTDKMQLNPEILSNLKQF